MSDQIKIQLVWREDVKVKGMTIPYQDAFYFTQEEYSAMSPEVLRAKKDERIANFKDAIEHPPVQPEPTEAQIQEQIDNLEAQKQSLVAQKADIASKAEAKVEEDKLEG